LIYSTTARKKLKKKLVVKSTMLLHRNVHNITWTSPDGQTQNQMVFRRAGCDTDQYPVVVQVRERLTVSKEAAKMFEEERFNLRKLNELEVKKEYQIKIANRFAALENLRYSEDIDRA
jgi:hypothetical protein